MSTGRLAMEAREARQSNWLARSTVRSLRPGTHFDLIGLPLDPANPKVEHKYLATDITHVGINNLSGEAIAAIAQRLGRAPLKIDAAHTPWLPGARLPITESALQNSSRRPSQPEILMARSESRMIAVDERHQRP